MDGPTREFYLACKSLAGDVAGEVQSGGIGAEEGEDLTASLWTYFGARTAAEERNEVHYCSDDVRTAVRNYVTARTGALSEAVTLLSAYLDQDAEQNLSASPVATIVDNYLVPWDSQSSTSSTADVDWDDSKRTRRRGFAKLSPLNTNVSQQSTLSPGAYFHPSATTPGSASATLSPLGRQSHLFISLTPFSATPQTWVIPDDRWIIDESHKEE